MLGKSRNRVAANPAESGNDPFCSFTFSDLQNQSLRYATHQLAKIIGIVAPSAHHRGSMTSANRPSAVKVIQKTLRSTQLFYSGA